MICAPYANEGALSREAGRLYRAAGWDFRTAYEDWKHVRLTPQLWQDRLAYLQERIRIRKRSQCKVEKAAV